MENATKALLIGTAVLIAIILLSLMAYAFTMMGRKTANVYWVMNSNELAEYNQKFLNYETVEEEDPSDPTNTILRNLLTPQDVKTIINLNQTNVDSGKLEVEIIIKDKEVNNSGTITGSKTYKKDGTNKLEDYDIFENLNHLYTCKVDFGDADYREYVRKVTIEFYRYVI